MKKIILTIAILTVTLFGCTKSPRSPIGCKCVNYVANIGGSTDVSKHAIDSTFTVGIDSAACASHDTVENHGGVILSTTCGLSQE